MPVLSRPSLVVLIGLVAFPGQAADFPRLACLSKAEQRAAVVSHQAISLAQALKVRTRARHGDLVSARLCRDGNRLVYVLTLLGRSGKVIVATVDAANGEPVSAR